VVTPFWRRVTTQLDGGDDHCVTHPHLGELMPIREVVGENHCRDQFIFATRRLLHPGEELLPRNLPGPLRRSKRDASVDSGQEGKAVSGRTGGTDVATDGGGVADLRGPHGPGRLGQCPRALPFNPSPGHPGPDPAAFPLLQVVDPAQCHDPIWTGVVEVHLDHQIGTSGQGHRPSVHHSASASASARGW
jgi:hypothetical protein